MVLWKPVVNNSSVNSLCTGMKILAWFLVGGKYYSHTWFLYTTGLLRYQRPQKDKKVQKKIKGLNTHCQFSGFWFIPFPVIFLVKIVQWEFFREITMFTSRLLSFHLTISFQHCLNHWIFYGFKFNFLLEAGQFLERTQWIQII